jgi:hypothetical protein
MPIVLALLLFGAAAARPALSQTLPRYDIYRTPSPIKIDGKLDEPAWGKTAVADNFHFNWYREGPKQETTAKLLWDDENLYVGYHCKDNHISATVTERHGPVSRDDCVEVFISPDPAKNRNYYGFEMNVIGTMLNFIRADWREGPFFWEPEGVRLRTSHHGLPVKIASADDDHWVLEIAIPFKNFHKDAANVPPRDGDNWRLNLNRVDLAAAPQYSTWSPVTTAKPNFHAPEAFGWVRFVSKEAGGSR